jgi:cytochrome c553
MSRLPRIIVVLAIATVAISLLVYARSQSLLARTYEVPLPAPTADFAPPDTAHGARLARLVGCVDGCHGRGGAGSELVARGHFRATAPTLSAVLPSYSDPELVGLLRFGVKRDARSAIGMPAARLYGMSDSDLRALTAAVRALPPSDSVARTREVGMRGRVGLALGLWTTSAAAVDRDAPRIGDQPQDTPARRGAYLANILCAQCHGREYEGEGYPGAPAFTVMRRFDEARFVRLMRQGVGHDDRELNPLMGVVVPEELRQLSDDDLRALWSFGRTVADARTGGQP